MADAIKLRPVLRLTIGETVHDYCSVGWCEPKRIRTYGLNALFHGIHEWHVLGDPKTVALLPTTAGSEEWRAAVKLQLSSDDRIIDWFDGGKRVKGALYCGHSATEKRTRFAHLDILSSQQRISGIYFNDAQYQRRDKDTVLDTLLDAIEGLTAVRDKKRACEDDLRDYFPKRRHYLTEELATLARRELDAQEWLEKEAKREEDEATAKLDGLSA